jgi:hypothetical protein
LTSPGTAAARIRRHRPCRRNGSAHGPDDGTVDDSVDGNQCKDDRASVPDMSDPMLAWSRPPGPLQQHTAARRIATLQGKVSQHSQSRHRQRCRRRRRVHREARQAQPQQQRKAALSSRRLQLVRTVTAETVQFWSNELPSWSPNFGVQIQVKTPTSNLKNTWLKHNQPPGL